MSDTSNSDRDRIVFVLPDGDKYHTFGQCPSLKLAVWDPAVWDMDGAEEAGLELCSKCDRLANTARKRRYPGSLEEVDRDG